MGNVVSAAAALLEKKREEHRQAFLRQAEAIIAKYERKAAEAELAKRKVVPFPGPAGKVNAKEVWRQYLNEKR